MSNSWNQVLTLSFLSNCRFLIKTFNFNQSFPFLHNLFITKFGIFYTHLEICINFKSHFVSFEYGNLVYSHDSVLFLSHSALSTKNQSFNADMKSDVVKKNEIVLKNVSNTNCQETLSSIESFFIRFFSDATQNLISFDPHKNLVSVLHEIDDTWC